jgi:hypothetical protein
MSRVFPLLCSLMLMACATAPQPHEPPVRSIAYQAVGQDPFWMVTIGDDRIVLRMANMNGDAIFPRTLPRTEDDVTIWQSSTVSTIVIEARPGPCANREGQVFEDDVLVRLSGDNIRTMERYTDEFTGCGGQLLQARGSQ